MNLSKYFGFRKSRTRILSFDLAYDIDLGTAVLCDSCVGEVALSACFYTDTVSPTPKAKQHHISTFLSCYFMANMFLIVFILFAILFAILVIGHLYRPESVAQHYLLSSPFGSVRPCREPENPTAAQNPHL